MKKTALLAVLAVALVFGIAAYATAASQTIIGTPNADGDYEAEGVVVVNASVNPKVELTLSEDIMDAGTLDPDTSPTWTGSVTVGTKSNVLCTLSTAVGGSVNGAAQPVFTSSLEAGGDIANLRGVTTRSDDYNMSIDYDTDPGTYQAEITYTLVQQ